MHKVFRERACIFKITGMKNESTNCKGFNIYMDVFVSKVKCVVILFVFFFFFLHLKYVTYFINSEYPLDEMDIRIAKCLSISEHVLIPEQK